MAESQSFLKEVYSSGILDAVFEDAKKQPGQVVRVAVHLGTIAGVVGVAWAVSRTKTLTLTAASLYLALAVIIVVFGWLGSRRRKYPSEDDGSDTEIYREQSDETVAEPDGESPSANGKAA